MPEQPTPLFPPYLNQGSRGGAVDKLHVLLDGWGFNEGLVADLQYGEMTAARVADLQRWLGVEDDGNFGPATRAALKERTGFDVNRIAWAPQDGITAYRYDDSSETAGIWPPNTDT